MSKNNFHQGNPIVSIEMLPGCSYPVVVKKLLDVALSCHWNPHLVRMDMRTPVMNGYAATEAIRALRGGDEVKIVAVTASAFEEQRDKILGTGCDELVCKPIRENEIFDAIARQFGVEFGYADIDPPADPEAEVEPTGEMVAPVPDELLEELRKAALMLDRESITAAMERIAAHGPDAAEGLQKLVDGFQLGRIRDLLGDVT